MIQAAELGEMANSLIIYCENWLSAHHTLRIFWDISDYFPVFAEKTFVGMKVLDILNLDIFIIEIIKLDRLLNRLNINLKKTPYGILTVL